MVITVSINPRFNKLNSNNLRTKQDFGSRERRAIVDITVPTSEAYSAGGFTVDFTKIRNFIEVYAGKVLFTSDGILATDNEEYRLIPGTDNAADVAKLGIVVTSTGAEFSGSTGSEVIITVEIIGI